MSKAGTKIKYANEFSQAAELAKRFDALLSEARGLSANVIHGAHGRRKRGSGETFWEFRHARLEDTASSIDWRRSAKGDALFVRETEWEAANTIYLWRDSSPLMNWCSSKGLPRKQDRAAVLLTALAMVLLRGGERCMIPGVSQKPGTGIGATRRIAHEIITGTSTAEQLVTSGLRAQTHLVLASDFLEGPQLWKERFSTMQKLGISVILLHISDPAEEEFPYFGHTVFSSLSGAEQIDFGRAQLAKNNYQQRFMANRQHISDLAKRAGWLFFKHRTDHIMGPVFHGLAQGLSGGKLS